jgi:hypothetical protein
MVTCFRASVQPTINFESAHGVITARVRCRLCQGQSVATKFTTSHLRLIDSKRSQFLEWFDGNEQEDPYALPAPQIRRKSRREKCPEFSRLILARHLLVTL